jgi:predicted porin
VPFGSSELKASYTSSNANDAAGTVGVYDARLFAISYLYSLSKRTALYTTGAVIDNDGNGVFALSGSPKVAPGGRSAGVDFGIRHSF